MLEMILEVLKNPYFIRGFLIGSACACLGNLLNALSCYILDYSWKKRKENCKNEK